MLSYQQQKERSRIGTVLVRKGLINPNQLDYAIRLQSDTHTPLGKILVDKRFITDTQLHSALNQQSLLRVTSMLIAFLLTPFQLAHSTPQSESATERGNLLQQAMTEDIEGIESVYKHSQLSEIKQQHANLDSQLDELWNRYDRLLKKHVTSGHIKKLTASLVDYNHLRHDPELQTVVNTLTTFPISEVASNEQKKAFYLNSYNILTLNMVTKNWPIKKLRSAGELFEPVWEKQAGLLDGKSVTLGEIEHEILRKLGDPRVHFAVNCASMSGPNLRTEAYRASQLDSQLDDQVRQFLAQDYKGAHQKSNTLQVSKIFKWFAADFQPQGGVDKFIRRYKPNLPPQIEIEPNLSYNWNINALVAASSERA